MSMNGNTALALAPEPPPAIERQIGAAIAAAGCLFCEAMLSYRQTGSMLPEHKVASGELLSRVVELQLSTFGEIDFVATAHREGKNQLRQFLRAPGFYQQLLDHGLFRYYGPSICEAVLDHIIGDVLLVAGRVFALERARAN
jgi:hypothetical protein